MFPFQFNTVFRNDQDRNYIHRLLLYRCRAPDGIDPVSLFEGVVKSEGSECYFLAQPNPLPTQYCRETIHVWAVGGRVIMCAMCNDVFRENLDLETF